ncbi:quinone-modifying oxidoreductase subunit QmoC [Desulfosalsimonas propionicica]|uniref:Quinone-modifying oxidoreductase subunit QmoC n=1 Tax=Desulfosalsimonas propionicica TaxID=332175 RepID=A0A7W0C6P3_9BACT|nr:quinone-interacting membrane-bound oxidoreductase complex subunit QmoC [Desulfosalsimonas propionicica]MBA2880118.1 quinone-modifying oxidoreductase subunit QmoC [Desulfosalsimonas propionicica]
MADKYLVQPDINFINEIRANGGESLKKCFQCATCSVACPIAPDRKPFPRKEMIAASWGLKDKLLSNPDIWLCHNCGDCSTLCPRGAKPGDVMASLRMMAINEYATPKSVANAVNDRKKLPLLIALPAIVFIVLGLITGLLDFSPGLNKHGEIAHANFFSTWLVDLVFIPLSIWAVAVFALGLKRFIADIHKNALAEGKTDKETIDTKGFLSALVRVIPSILKHSKFSECGENNNRATPHMMVLFSFIGLLIVTGVFFVTLYVFGIHGPYSQLNPIKILANVSGIALIIGAALLIKQRMDKTDEISTYKDWYLLWLVLGLGVTGMLAELTRMADAAFLTYLIYFIHLMLVFHLIAFLPFSKLAHLVYRTVALAYNEYSGREAKKV